MLPSGSIRDAPPNASEPVHRARPRLYRPKSAPAMPDSPLGRSLVGSRSELHLQSQETESEPRTRYHVHFVQNDQSVGRSILSQTSIDVHIQIKHLHADSPGAFPGANRLRLHYSRSVGREQGCQRHLVASSFEYDGLGQRTAQTAGGLTTQIGPGRMYFLPFFRLCNNRHH